MEQNKVNENSMAGTLQDDELEQVGGGAAANYTGQFYVVLAEGKKMNDLWDAMYQYGSYGKAVKEVVDAYCMAAGLQKREDLRYRATAFIEVSAKNEVVTVNGTRVYLP